ncbi:hypothetical protein A2714_05060 [Candidatus Woesebacteria bacterium RIFCSPHIGHO2_01_FULL_38_9]|uniref:Nudix hydrolase domain-containing protein n=2 Tax=Candidatus Woeseibacteriota TaxID=1752722 RepID=A0A1F7Y2N4_9BACT|nr:MAG: hypothetical protein A2714_05060 [Candidatus Woesebacteria bacterium RIFCSPHIGHO2_01_FULL_38_9]OGM60899.1 MAG: hypothetical protein A3A75_02305 [Candidatus Woesebacteria bacterium RIFCSPLOWO2_01_FULL_39_10]
MKIRKGVVLVVKNKKGEYLLLRQRKSKSYSFISGGLEFGERYTDAAVREAREEAGLKINLKKLTETDQKIKFSGSRKGPAEQKVFVYRPDGADVNIKVDNNEISGYEWCSKEEAFKKLKNKPPLISLIQKADNY